MSDSRGPRTLADLVVELGPRARAATVAEAAAAGDVVVVTIPLGSYRSVPVEALRSTSVIATINCYSTRDGRISEFDHGSTADPAGRNAGARPAARNELAALAASAVRPEPAGTGSEPAGTPDDV